jgi:hypothetical protein
MLILEVTTALPAADVIERAKSFFLTRFSPYSGWLTDSSERHARFQFEAGVLTVGAIPQEHGTLVRGSTSRLHHELSQFLATLSVPEAVRQNMLGPGTGGAG